MTSPPCERGAAQQRKEEDRDTVPIRRGCGASVTTVADAVLDDVQALRDGRPGAMADPFRVYARLRSEAPVLRLDDIVLVSRWEDVQHAHVSADFGQRPVGDEGYSVPGAPQHRLADPEQHRLLSEISDVTGRWLSYQDGEDHARLRRLAHKAFTPRAVARQHARVEEIANELLDAHAREGTMEVVADFAFQLPLIVVSEMLDVPPEDRFKIREWTSGLAAFTDWGVAWGERDDMLRRAHACAQNLFAHLDQVFESRRGKPTTSLLDDLLAAEDDGDRFTREELVGMCTQIIRAGHETTTNLIAVGLHSLLSQRDQWELLRDDPGLVPNAVEELIRFKSPTQKNERIAHRACELGGVEIRPNDKMGLLIGSANRDPDHWTDPDVLDVTRADTKHIGFGWGPHHCLGSALNRLETAVAFRTLLRRFPDIRLASEEVAWRRLWTFCGLEALPVRLGEDHG
jgi:cytochrome P450